MKLNSRNRVQAYNVAMSKANPREKDFGLNYREIPEDPNIQEIGFSAQ